MANLKLALIRAGVVENIIVAELAFAQTLGFDAVVPLTGGLPCSPGDFWNGAVFTPRPPNVEVESQRTIETQAAQALDQLRAYIAIPTPTAAQRLAFERLTARLLIGFIRLQLKQLDDTG